ncbi:uncharacterized protein AMSG_12254 [Thecamonas trahens ATCC 50062]|uniref:Uncharacterized protein n=1 Tax=Thecamonas trahens ATCC 50062 TaxID=461836 RepID=A0A0L0DLG5_THETB|nr:hypothetical protein AMSG_12254 [Thecamonas trahens ATCC 50062]KNC53075.1 hypothetical protein AMSG_12254 [Thecamonas trahens ATCC 50062]|eukprot:XP_013754802.1 hypothetical protein AMSG_12254 [Thecamonas trahens ATCC 50062]
MRSNNAESSGAPSAGGRASGSGVGRTSSGEKGGARAESEAGGTSTEATEGTRQASTVGKLRDVVAVLVLEWLTDAGLHKTRQMLETEGMALIRAGSNVEVPRVTLEALLESYTASARRATSHAAVLDKMATLLRHLGSQPGTDKASEAFETIAALVPPSTPLDFITPSHDLFFSEAMYHSDDEGIDRRAKRHRPMGFLDTITATANGDLNLDDCTDSIMPLLPPSPPYPIAAGHFDVVPPPPPPHPTARTGDSNGASVTASLERSSPPRSPAKRKRRPIHNPFPVAELLCTILSFLDVWDLAAASATCTALHTAATDPYLLATLVHTVRPPPALPPQRLMDFLAARSSLRRLDLSERTVSFALLGSLPAACPRLEALTLDSCLGFAAFYDGPPDPSVPKLGIVQVVQALNGSLRSISLRNTRGLNCELGLLLAAGGGNLVQVAVTGSVSTKFSSFDPNHAASLRVLDLAACRGLSNDGLAALLAAATGLISLCVARTAVTGAGFAAASLPRLTNLVIAGCMCMGDECMLAVLSGAPALRILDASFLPITNDGVAAIAAHAPNLTSLTLRKCSHLGPGALAPLALAGTRLRVLNVAMVSELSHEDVVGVIGGSGALSRLVIAGRLTGANWSSLLTTPHLDRLRSVSLSGLAHLADEVVGTLLASVRLARIAVVDCGGFTGIGFEDLKLGFGAAASLTHVAAYNRALLPLEHNVGMVSAIGRNCVNLVGLRIDAKNLTRLALLRWRTSHLRELHIAGCEETIDDVSWILPSVFPAYVSKPTKLALPWLSLRSSDLVEVLASQPARFLHSLDLHGTHIDNDILPLVFTALPLLTDLDISNCLDLDDNALNGVDASRPNRITTLNLSGARGLGVRALRRIATVSPNVTSLNSADLPGAASLVISSLFPLLQVTGVGQWLHT